MSKLSNIKELMSEGAVPLSVNGLNLSKLVGRVGGTSRISPPLGAFGFT
jgi:hypothetical protein